jgi:hypothetical protein
VRVVISALVFVAIPTQQLVDSYRFPKRVWNKS